jgi:hypothetical protein
LEPFFDFGLFEIFAACAAWRVARRGWHHIAYGPQPGIGNPTPLPDPSASPVTGTRAEPITALEQEMP